MATVFELLSEAGQLPVAAPNASQQKQLAVAVAANQKIQALGGPTSPTPTPQDFYNTAVTNVTGSGQATRPAFEQDLASLTPLQLRQAYGSEKAVALQSGLAEGYHAVRRDMSGGRSDEQVLSDTVSGVGSGLANGIANIGAFGLGLVSDDAGAWASQKIGEANDFIQSTQSPTLRASRRLNSARNQLDSRDNAAEHSGIGRILADAWDSVGNAVSDPTMLSDGIAQGVGSLLAGGPVSRALRGSMTGAIGLMEAGGAYQGTASDIMDKSHAELMEGSDRYKTLVTRNGMTPDQAKRQVASEAGLWAAPIQGVVGAATGRLVSKFEGDPLAVQTFREIGKNILKETAEEGIQGATGQLAQNTGTRIVADKNQDMLEGVGEQLGTGALYGAGTAGALQAPGGAARAALKTAEHTGRAAVRTFKAADAALQSRAETLAAKSAAVPDQKVAEATPIIAAEAPKAAEEIKQALQETKPFPTEDEQKAIDDFTNQVMSITTWNDEAIQASPEIPDNVKQITAGSKDRVEAAQRLAAEVTKIKTVDSSNIDLILTLMNEISRYQNFANSAPSTDIPDGTPGADMLNRYIGFGQDVMNSHTIKKAYDQAQAFMASMDQEAAPKPEMREESLSTPQGQQDIQRAVSFATHNPTKADLPTVERAMFMAEQGQINLTPAQMAALKSSAVLLKANIEAKNSSLQMKRAEDAKLNLVSEDILDRTKGDNSNEKLSAAAHARTILDFYRAGRKDMATKALADLGNFAQSQVNKLNAINEHFTQGGKPRNYQAHLGIGKFGTPKEQRAVGITLKGEPRSIANSINFAQTVALQSQAVVAVYNGLMDAFPELGGKKLAKPELHQELHGNKDELAVEYAQGKRVAPWEASQNGVKSRTSPEKIKTFSDEKLNDQINRALDKRKKSPKSWTEQDEATFIALDDEMTRRETEAARQAEEDERQEREAIQAEAKAAEARIKAEEAAATGTPAPKVSSEGSDQAPKVSEEVDPFAKLYSTETTPNLFTKVYKQAKEQLSRLHGSKTPFKVIRDALKSRESLQAFTDGDASTQLSEDTAKAYADYLKQAGKLKNRMEEQLQWFMGVKVNKNLEEYKRDQHIWRQGKALNIAEQDENGDFRFNQELVESAILAGMQWALTADHNTAELDEQSIADMTGLELEDVETNADFVQAMRQGVTAIDATSALSQKIQEYWGVLPNRDQPDGWVQGVSEAVAKQVLDAMVFTKMVRAEKLKISDYFPDVEDAEVSQREVNKFIVTRKSDLKAQTPKGQKTVDPLEKDLSVIDKTVLKNPEDVFFFEGNKPPVARFQMRNKAVENSRSEKKMIENENGEIYNFNIPLIEFYDALDEDLMVDLLANGDLTGRPLNKQHAKTLEGQNLNVRSAYHALRAMAAQGRIQTDADGKLIPLEQAKIFFAHNISKVGRLQQLGRFGPQASKLVREAVLPTWSTLDLSGENPQHMDAFLLGIGQAIGVKVHNKSRQEMRADVAKLVNEPSDEMIEKGETSFKPSLDLLSQFLETKYLPDGAVESIKNNFAQMKTPVTAVALHALMEYARLNQVKDQTNFRTGLYLEADGVTNGVVNAMVMMTTGEFAPNWVMNVQKGGFLPSENGPHTMNEVRSGKNPEATEDDERVFEKNPNDLYQTTTDHLQATELPRMQARVKQADADSRYPSNPVMQEQFKALITVIALLMPKEVVSYDLDAGTITFNRGIAKNPLTVTLYGSGLKGVAGKLTTIMLKEYYARMTQVAEAQASAKKDGVVIEDAVAMFGKSNSLEVARDQYARFDRAWKKLLNSQARETREGKLYVKQKPFERLSNDPVEVKLSTKQFRNLQQNVQTLFVVPLSNAIISTVGENLFQSANMIKTSTQVQSIYLKYAFAREILKEMHAAKAADPNWAPSDFISQKAQEAAFKRLAYLFPFVKTANQTFFPASRNSVEVPSMTTMDRNGKEKTKEDVSFSATFSGKIETPGFLPGPGNSGVAGIPMLNIGMGDGMMMQAISVAEKVIGKLLIFDGMNGKLSTIMEDGMAANEGVWKSWQGNPLEAVYDSYSQFMNSALKEEISDRMRAELSRAFGAKKDELLSDEQIQNGMMLLNTSLEEASASREARIRTLKKFKIRIDQMAAAGSPYVNEGEVITTNDPQEISNILNEEYAKQLKDVTAEFAARSGKSLKHRTVRSKPDKQVSEMGKLHKASGVRILSQTALAQALRKLGMSDAQKQIFSHIKLSKAIQDYTVVHGTLDQMKAYAAATNGQFLSEAEMQAAGQIGGFKLGKTLFIVNPTADVLVHEMIHAATQDTLDSYFRGEPQSPFVDDAIRGLIELKDRFKLLNFYDFASSDQMNSYQNALESMARFERANDPAGALGEFIAWGLANQPLNEVLKAENVVVRYVKEVLQAIKNLIFGKARMPKQGETMLDRLAFHTALIVRHQASLAQQSRQSAMFMSTSYGNNERLANVNDAYERLVVAALPDKLVHSETMAQTSLLLDNAGVLAAVTSAFPMTMQERTTFDMITAALMTQSRIEPVSLQGAQELYNHVLKHLEPESFRLNSDPNDTADYLQSVAKYEVLLGKTSMATDKQGRSSLLPVFLALATTNDTFREQLAKMPLPRTVLGGGTTDQVLENFGNNMLEKLSDHLIGTAKSGNVKQAIDALQDEIHRVSQERKHYIEIYNDQAGGAIDWLNDKIKDGLSMLADEGFALGKTLKADGSKLKEALGNSLQLVSAIASEDKADKVAAGIMAATNNLEGFVTFREFVAEATGRTESNKGVYDLIKIARSYVQKVRQNFRETVPSVIKDQFKTEPTEREWSLLHKGFGKMDVAALVGERTVKDVLKLLSSDKAIAAEINAKEQSLQAADPQHWRKVQAKANQLATYMNTGKRGTNLLRNARAVAALLNERKFKSRINPSAEYVAELDQLISLYAFQDLPEQDRKDLASMVQNEPEGTEFSLSYLVGQRVEETRKAARGRAKFNAYKGYIPSAQQAGVSLVIGTAADHADLISKSYQRVAEYRGSPAEMNRQRRWYYFAPVSARSTFDQGIHQSIRQTAGGVDSNTGYSELTMTAGRITDSVLVGEITDRLAALDKGDIDNLVAVFDEDGDVVAYERSVDPKELERLNHDTHFAKAVGQWRGRQIEELNAQDYNYELINRIHEMWTKRPKGSDKEFINVLDRAEWKKDPVLADAMKLMTWETEDYANSLFDGEGLWVRREMVNDAFGYRRASVGDSWTGTSRWSPETQTRVKNLATSFMGNDAYKNLLFVEKGVTGFVKDARLTIAVKSGIVPAANFISNIYQMMSRGIPAMDIWRGVPRKIAEINAYQKGLLLEAALEVKIRAAEGDKNTRLAQSLNTQLQATRDSYKRLSIWPLIQAGEFTAISDAGISRDDILLSEGRVHAYMEKLVEKLPPEIQTMGKYAIVAKDTALFQGMQKAVDFGDLIAKALTYDDLVKRQKMSSEDALGRVSEEFVNYDRLSGRTRDTLENLGLLWFWKFKIRATKIALSTIRNNPVHALLAGMMPTPDFLSVGTSLSDNLVSKAVGGTLDYSIGPMQGFRAWSLNPFWNFFN